MWGAESERSEGEHEGEKEENGDGGKNGEEESSKLHPVSRSTTNYLSVQRSERKVTTSVEEGRAPESAVQVTTNSELNPFFVVLNLLCGLGTHSSINNW